MYSLRALLFSVMKRKYEQHAMIKNAQKMDVAVTDEVASPTKRALPTLRARRLSAIEIAEGALLADIAVVFQLLITYLPVGGGFLQLLVPVIFAVLVLRRGLYVGCMSLCVALFIISIVMGPGGVPALLLEAGAGLFLGLTMRARLSHVLTIVLGAALGGLALWALLLFFSLLSGGSHLLVRSLHRIYAFITPLLGLFFKLIHLNGLWQQHLFPLLDAFMQWGFQNWLVLFYLLACFLCIPLTIGTYFITNFFLRLLGYRVRPLPGYRVEGLLYWLARGLQNWLVLFYLLASLLYTTLMLGVYFILNFFSRFRGYQMRPLPGYRLRELLYWLAHGLFRPVPRRVYARFPALYNLKREVRRLNMARLRQHHLEKKADSKSVRGLRQGRREKEVCKSV
jgi:hypothetical protein